MIGAQSNSMRVPQQQSMQALWFVSVFPSVSGLLKWGCPFAVFRAVWAIVVNAFNAVSRWAFGLWPHVGKKIFKRFPPVANRNSSSAVIWVRYRIFAKAPFPHFFPRIVLWWVLSAAFCCPMSSYTLGKSSSAALAAARNRMPCSDALNNDFFNCATMTTVGSIKTLAWFGFSNALGYWLTNHFKCHKARLPQKEVGTQPLMGVGL